MFPNLRTSFPAAADCDDPDLGPLVETFLSDLPYRMEQLRSLAVANSALAAAALRLETAFESYGLGQLAPGARRIAQTVAAGASTEEIAAAVDDLADLCRQIDVR